MKLTIFWAAQSASAKIDAGDRDKAKDDCRGLRDLATVGPLHTLKLGPAGTQECDRTMVDRLGRRASERRSPGAPVAERLSGRCATAATTTPARRDELGRWSLVGAFAILLDVDLLLERGRRRRRG